MKPNSTRRTLSSLALVAALLATLPAAAADLSATLAGLARYESGGDVRPLREIERLVGESADDVQLRADLEAGLARLLTGDATFEARRFACQNLAVIGDAASVPALAGLLGRDETVGIAAAALAQNPSDQAGTALRTALSSVTGRARAQLAFALGTRRDPEAVEMLTRLAADGDLGVAEAAVVALGKIGDEPAQSTLATLRKQSSAALTRAVAEASFTLADALVRKGDQTAAAAIYRDLVAPGNPDDIRRGALGGLLRTDADGGEQRMLEVLGGTDAALKPVAISALPELKSPGASKTFAGVLPKLDPGEQFLLVQALALRRDADAREAIAQQLESPSGLVRSAAIESLGQAGDASTVPVLARATLSAKNPAELRAVEFALASLKGGEAVDQALAAQLRNRMAGPKAPFLAALVRRANPVSSGVFLGEAANTDPAMVRLAFQGLSGTATDEQLAAVLEALGGLKAKAALDDAQASVGQLLKRVGSPPANAAAIRGALAKASGADAQAALLPMLAICPDAEGLKQVEAAATSANAETRDLGLRTLADWPDAAAWGPLTARYATAGSETERVLVLRGLARLLGEQNARPDAQLVSRYRETLASAKTDNDRKLLLGSLAGCNHPDALKLAVEQLANAGVRAEATLAVKKIAENIRAQHPQAADDALKLLREAQERAPREGTRPTRHSGACRPGPLTRRSGRKPVNRKPPTNPSSATRRFPSLRLSLLVTVILASSPVLAQTPSPSPTDEVRREIQKVREEYEQRIRALEQRLNELEAAQKTAPSTPAAQPPPAPPPTAPGPLVPPPRTEPPPEVAPTTAVLRPPDAAAVANQFRPNTESIYRYLNTERDDAIAKRVQQIMYDFLDITGYVRAGYGRNDRGGVQVPFMAPGAQAKYRLGNETEVYSELAFGKNFYLADTFAREHESESATGEPLSGPVARIQIRPSYSLSYSGVSSWGLPEAWGAVGNVFAAQPGLKFWAGNRFYRRYDVHINDWFFYNMGGLGGGVEGFDLGFGKVALAWIGNASGSAAYTDEIVDEAENRDGFAKSSLDLRLYDVPLPLGKGEFGVVYARTEGGFGTTGNGTNDPFEVPDADGFSFHFLHLAEKFLDERSVNKFSIQGGWGGAKNLSSGFEIFNLGGVNYITPELPDAWRVRVSEDFVLQPSDLFSVGAVVAFQYTDYDQMAVPGLGGSASGVYGGQRYWYTAGARPILHFNRNLSLAFEGGVDYTDTDGVVDSVSNLHGTLWKFTVAPQVSLGRHFMSRPVIRAYFTYAGWLDGFEGYVGGPTYGDRDYGYAAGIQLEAWW